MTEPHPADPPADADRPVPLVVVPEGTSEPSDWSTASTTPVDPPVGDDDRALEDRQAAQRRDRRTRAAVGGPPPADEDVPEQSSYSTEVEQGAAQPGPTRRETDG